MRNKLSFKRSVDGSVALVFALSIIPVFGIAGIAVDYSRAGELKSRMATAADAAALAGSRMRNAPIAERKRVATDMFMSNMKGYELGTLVLRITEVENGLRVEAEIEQQNKIMTILDKPVTRVTTISQAAFTIDKTDLALVLDVTGSMRDDMGALKLASKDFINIIMGDNPSDDVRMSIVPFNASVNVGVNNISLSMMDTDANSAHHARALKGQQIADIAGCNSNPFPSIPSPGAGSGGGSGGGGGTLTPTPAPAGPRGSDKKTHLKTYYQHFASIAVEMFGVHQAFADVTPSTSFPLTGGGNYTPGAPYAAPTLTVFSPAGFPIIVPCAMRNPTRISHFDLFNRIPNARWKGCVEARPEPYDVTDTAPNRGDANTLFVPYFWPDEGGNSGDTTYSNSYMADRGSLPIGWNLSGDTGSFANLFKYDGINPANIREIGPLTFGPNAGCPDELVRLTSNKNVLTAKIDSLSHWFGGGTIVSEGAVWGWRTISKNPPFADGSTDKKAKKFMLLMSDGANTIEANNTSGPTISDYSAYGYIRNGRFGTESYPDVEDYLDKRQSLACKNIHKDNVRVYTVLFREVNEAAVKGMRECASEAKNFYTAKNGSELRRAFQEIAQDILKLRLTR